MEVPIKMTVDYKNQMTNDSYNRCIAELRARYSGRGVANNFKSEMAQRAKKEEIASGSTESYVFFNTGNKIGDSYRSGEYNGSRYMTSDDFVRYFKSKRAFFMPSALKPQKGELTEVKENHAVPKRKGMGSVTVSESGSKESHTRGLTSVVKKFAREWLCIEPRENRADNTRFRIPVTALSGIAVFVISLGMIVSSSVMAGRISADMGELNSEIAVLEAEQSDLRGKLDLKYNINEIEEDAKALGMIKREYADNEYIEVLSKKEIEIYDENEDRDLNLAALLSAFGIELD